MICDNTGRNMTSNLSSKFLQVSYKDIEVSKTHDNDYSYYRKHIVMILILLGVDRWIVPYMCVYMCIWSFWIFLIYF